jgi:alpha/beta superfamily hydrolase
MLLKYRLIIFVCNFPAEASAAAIKSKPFARRDISMPSALGHTLQVSLWNPVVQNDCCILYMHPNSGNRMDAIRSRALSFAMVLGCSACGFDFSGCGQSEGEYISLGVKEKDDVGIS